MTKVVEFPKDKIVREVPQHLPEIEKAKEKSRLNFADSIVDDITANIFSEFENYGLETDGKEFAKDFTFSADALRACVYRIIGIKHHLHDFIDTNVMVESLSDIRMKMEKYVELELEDDLDNQE
jgi:hypothetical protein